MKWQRVEQFVEPVVCRVGDVRVQTQELTQRRRVEGVVLEDVGRPVQHHQQDQTLLAFNNHVVVVSEVELRHIVRAETR